MDGHSILMEARNTILQVWFLSLRAWKDILLFRCIQMSGACFKYIRVKCMPFHAPGSQYLKSMAKAWPPVTKFQWTAVTCSMKSGTIEIYSLLTKILSTVFFIVSCYKLWWIVFSFRLKIKLFMTKECHLCLLRYVKLTINFLLQNVWYLFRYLVMLHWLRIWCVYFGSVPMRYHVQRWRKIWLFHATLCSPTFPSHWQKWVDTQIM